MDDSSRGSKDSLTHLDAQGRPTMVDVGDKTPTDRRAVASGVITVGPRAYPLLADGDLPKGDALVTARLAAIQGVKRTWETIPLCHPIPLDGVEVEWTLVPERYAVEVTVTTRCHARTGIEMEALHGAAVFLLTIYDMAKAVEREMTIGPLRLEAKSGGRSGDYRRGGDDAGSAPHRGS